MGSRTNLILENLAKSIGSLVSQSWFVVTLPHGLTELDKLSPLNPNGFCHFLVQLTIEDRVEEAVDRDHHKCKNFKYRTAKMNGIQQELNRN